MTTARKGAAALVLGAAVLGASAVGVGAAYANEEPEPETAVTFEQYEVSETDQIERAPSPGTDPGSGGEIVAR